MGIMLQMPFERRRFYMGWLQIKRFLSFLPAAFIVYVLLQYLIYQPELAPPHHVLAVSSSGRSNLSVLAPRRTLQGRPRVLPIGDHDTGGILDVQDPSAVAALEDDPAAAAAAAAAPKEPAWVNNTSRGSDASSALPPPPPTPATDPTGLLRQQTEIREGVSSSSGEPPSAPLSEDLAGLGGTGGTTGDLAGTVLLDPAASSGLPPEAPSGSQYPYVLPSRAPSASPSAPASRSPYLPRDEALLFLPPKEETSPVPRPVHPRPKTPPPPPPPRPSHSYPGPPHPDYSLAPKSPKATHLKGHYLPRQIGPARFIEEAPVPARARSHLPVQPPSSSSYSSYSSSSSSLPHRDKVLPPQRGAESYSRVLPGHAPLPGSHFLGSSQIPMQSHIVSGDASPYLPGAYYGPYNPEYEHPSVSAALPYPHSEAMVQLAASASSGRRPVVHQQLLLLHALGDAASPVVPSGPDEHHQPLEQNPPQQQQQQSQEPARPQDQQPQTQPQAQKQPQQQQQGEQLLTEPGSSSPAPANNDPAPRAAAAAAAPAPSSSSPTGAEEKKLEDQKERVRQKLQELKKVPGSAVAMIAALGENKSTPKGMIVVPQEVKPEASAAKPEVSASAARAKLITKKTTVKKSSAVVGAASSGLSINALKGKIKVSEKYEHGFSVPHEELCPNNGRDLKVLVLITTAPDHEKHRMAIRQTWGSYAIRKDITMAFMVGRVHDATVQTNLDNENELYGDIIQTNFIDHYTNLTLKTISMFEWVNTYCSESHFILKTDDDMFINMNLLLHFIDTKKYDKHVMYGRLAKGWKPVRNKKSKYYIGIDTYSRVRYPDFLTGPAYLFTNDVVEEIYQKALSTTFFVLEDVLLTGIVGESLHIKRIGDSRFRNEKIKISDTCAVMKTISIHMVKYEEQFDMHKRLLDGKTKCKVG